METILLVEDDFIVRDNISSLLYEEGYETLLASNGSEAYSILQSNKPSLIISDIAMPVMDGFELLRKIREDNRTKTIPVIFLTAKTEREYFRKGMNLGADDFITKPFYPEEILDAIESKLNKKDICNRLVQESKENILKYLPHELRTLLVPILGYSDLILDNISEMTDSDIKHIISEIKKSGNRLSGWIEKFILFVEVSELINNSDSLIDVSKFTCNTEDILWEENFLQSKDWFVRREDIQIDLTPSNLQIQKSHLNFIIKELIENSCKFSDKGSKIKTSGYKQKEMYKITVEDFGRGIDGNEIKEIDIFNQFERNSLQQNGNGLGLAIIKRLMTIYKGEIEIDSKKNEFTTVSVLLPLSKKLRLPNNDK